MCPKNAASARSFVGLPNRYTCIFRLWIFLSSEKKVQSPSILLLLVSCPTNCRGVVIVICALASTETRKVSQGHKLTTFFFFFRRRKNTGTHARTKRNKRVRTHHTHLCTNAEKNAKLIPQDLLTQYFVVYYFYTMDKKKGKSRRCVLKKQARPF